MILIKRIEWIETDRDPEEIIYYNRPDVSVLVDTEHGADTVEVSTVRELCYGRRFRRPGDLKEVCIGMSREAATLIGMQHEAWQGMEERLDAERMMTCRLQNELNTVKTASFWQRLIWLFTGIK